MMGSRLMETLSDAKSLETMLEHELCLPILNRNKFSGDFGYMNVSWPAREIVQTKHKPHFDHKTGHNAASNYGYILQYEQEF